MSTCYRPLADGKQTNDGTELNCLKLFGHSKPRPKLPQHTSVRIKTAGVFNFTTRKVYCYWKNTFQFFFFFSNFFSVMKTLHLPNVHPVIIA
jgi:hypothetical protein